MAVPSVNESNLGRVAFLHSGHTSMTLATGRYISLSLIPPASIWPIGRVCRLARFNLATRTRLFDGSTKIISPSFPRSFPQRTFTLSCLRTVNISFLKDFRRQRNNFQIIALAKLTGDRTKDPGAARLAFFVDHDAGVVIKTDVAAVLP